MRATHELVVLALIVLLVNITFVSAITGSMGNARMILYPEVNGWTTTTIEKSILTKNVNDIPIDIKLEVAEDSTEFLELVDENFILEPGTEKKAEFLVKVRKEGTYNGKINVFFSSVADDNESNKEPGVALSSTIIVIAKKDQDYNEIDEEDVDNSETDVDEDGGVSVSFGGNPDSTKKGRVDDLCRYS